MTTTINASTSSGLVTTPDNSGAIALQNNGVTGINISSSGIVTMPLQYAFGVYCEAGGSITGDGTYYNIGTSANMTVFTNSNIGSCFSTSTGRFTAPVAGNYFFSAYANPNTSVTGPALSLLKNDGTSQFLSTTYLYNAAYNGSAVSTVVTLAAGDYVTARFIVYNGVTSGAHRSGFTGFLFS